MQQRIARGQELKTIQNWKYFYTTVNYKYKIDINGGIAFFLQYNLDAWHGNILFNYFGRGAILTPGRKTKM